jgi:hypothetical protein
MMRACEQVGAMLYFGKAGSRFLEDGTPGIMSGDGK